jgi:DNA-binding NtrC family response regulator
VTHFLNAYNEENDRYVVHIEPRAMEAMQDYAWPGNVRELQNYIERAVVMAAGDELTWELLPPVVRGEPGAPRGAFRRMDFESLAVQLVEEGLAKADDEACDLHSRIVDRVEREVISQVLGSCDNVQIKAAQRLGINRNTLHKKIKDYGLEGGENGSSTSKNG